MSSANQHSNSRPSTPKWRSSLSSPRRQRPATAVSVVFAEPEQGARLGSALDRLPAVAAIDDAASFVSEVSRKRERLNSNASSFRSQIEPRDEQIETLRENRDTMRKRSRLNVDAQNCSAEVSDADTEGTTILNAQGSASNPVDLTESPKPMDVNLKVETTPPSSGQDNAVPPHAPETAPPAPEAALIPFPTADPQRTIRASKSTPSRSSWFGFSRSKGDDSSSTAQQPTTADATPSGPPHAPTQTATSPIPVAQFTIASDVRSTIERDGVIDLSTSPLAQTQAPVATSPPRSIPSTTNKEPTPMSFSPIQYSPPTQAAFKSNTTSISSVDEDVPVQRPRLTSIDVGTSLMAPQAVVQAHDPKTAGRKPSISSLNPTTSRFTLRIPLLGRPKIPLDQAVASAQAEDIRDSPTTTLDSPTSYNKPSESDDGASNSTGDSVRGAATSGDSEDGAAAPQAINIVPPSPDEQQSDSANAESSTSAESNRTARPQDQFNPSASARPASWWDYVGWSGNGQPQPTQSGGSEEDKHDDSKQAEAHMEESPVTQSAPDEQAAPTPNPHGPATATEEPSPQNKDNEEVPPSDAKYDKKAASVFSAETVRSHGSVWYSPWAWYSPPANASSATAPADVTGSTAPKTESEMVKEEALARDQEERQAELVPEPEPVPPPSHEREATPEPANPIQSTLSENRSGWMSFFVSKAATMKAVTNEASEKKDEGMEVMEIDDDDDDAPDPSVATEVEIPQSKDAKKVVPIPKPLSLLSSSPTPSLPSPVPTPKTPKLPTSKSSTVPSPQKEREPKKQDPPAPPLTDSESVKRDTARGARTPSPTPSKSSTSPTSAKPSAPNLVLPTWADTFHSPPRSYVPPRSPNAKSKLTGALSFVAGALFSNEGARGSKGGRGKGKEKDKNKGKEREQFGTWSASTGATSSGNSELLTYGRELPKALDVLGEQLNPYILNGGCRVVVIGVAGWAPGAVTRTLAGGLPSSSSKFVNMTVQALEQFAQENGFKFKKITPMPLEGDGTIRKKVSRVYNYLLGNEEWLENLHAADVVFVASHSQGAIVATHLIDRLIEDGHILTTRSVDTLAKTAASIAAGGAAAVPTTQAQKVCLLSLCGIHLGPLRYLKTSSLLQPYFQYVENASARELFEFQDTESAVSKNYIAALRNIMDHGSKVVYIASLNDQVVPIYSGLFTAASHPRILRALYIDSDAYHSSDFLSNLLILLIRVLNAGLSDRGLLAHLSEATAGTLSGVGHSTAYEEPATYSLAVKYFFMTNDGTNSDAELVITPFNAVDEQNDYEIPWLLRDMIADNKISHFFAREFAQLRDAFDDWQPKTTILRDVKKKLQPITRLSSTATLASASISKL